MAELQIPSRSLTPGITTTLYQRGKNLFLFVLNSTTEDKVAGIVLQSTLLQEDEYQIQDLFTQCKWSLARKDDNTVHVGVRHKDATLLKLTPVMVNGQTDLNKRSD
jgi:hypothetical protein